MKIGSLLVLSIAFFILRCSESSNLFPVPGNESSGNKSLLLDYGNSSGSLIGISPEPDIQRRGNKICWDSRNRELLDFGPRLSICFPEESEYEFSLDWIFHSLDIAKQSLIQSSLLSSYPRFSIEHESGTVYFDYISETALRNLWRNNIPKTFILGDLRMKKFLNEKFSFKRDNEFLQLSLSYGLPYWNYYGGEECFFFFTSWDLDIPANQRRILRIQFNCDYLNSYMEQFKTNILSVHENMKANCEKKYPGITEFFSHSSSKHGRYIELHNSGDLPLCSNEFLLNTEDTNATGESGDTEGESRRGKVWKPEWDFIFPKATILLARSDSRLHSYDWIEDFDWGNMANGNSEIHGLEFNMQQSMSGFRYEDEFISQRNRPYPCNLERSNYHSSEKFCGSPGFHWESPIDWGLFCSPSDIKFTELNFWGIQDRQEFLDSRDRFLEFEVLPQGDKNICDLSSLYLDIENQQFPLYTRNSLKQNSIPNLTIGNKNDVILVSLSNKLPFGIRRIPRNLFQLNPARSIRIGAFGQPKSTKVVWDPTEKFQNSQFRVLSRDSESSLYSLVPVIQEENSESPIYTHHKPTRYDEWSSHGSLNYMSPGQVQFNAPSKLGNLTISEVLWPGSYRDGTSILGDRFIEWKTDQEAFGSFFLSILYPNAPNRNQTYMIPMEKDRFTLLSRGSLECFPWVRGLQHNQFSLFNDPALLKIQDESGKLHQELFLDTKLYGINQTSNKFRASAVYLSHDEIGNTVHLGWNTSKETDSYCPGEVAASPGSSNSSIELGLSGEEENQNE